MAGHCSFHLLSVEKIKGIHNRFRIQLSHVFGSCTYHINFAMDTEKSEHFYAKRCKRIINECNGL